MSSIESIVKFNAQTVGRDRLIRLFQYVAKLAGTLLRIYYKQQHKGNARLLEIIFKLRELEQFFLSCRRMLNFGRCTDQMYSALRSLQAYDPIIRMTQSTSKFWTSFQMFADHVLWLNQVGLLQVDKQLWLDRANKFWLYSVTVNLFRDFYELICAIQQGRTRTNDNLESDIKNLSLSSPVKWAKKHPKLSCDLVKNTCDFWIPYAALNRVSLNPGVVALLGIVSTCMGIMQIYDKKYRLAQS